MASNRQELLRTFTLANEFKEGDLGVGGTREGAVRASARAALGAFTLGELSANAFVEDGVSEALDASLDRAARGGDRASDGRRIEEPSAWRAAAPGGCAATATA